MEGEARRVGFLAAAPGDIDVGRLGDRRSAGAADGNAILVYALDLAANPGHRVEAPVLVQELAEAEPDGRSRRLLQTQAGPSSEIEAEIANIRPRRDLLDLGGLESGRDPDGRLGLGLERADRIDAGFCVCPAGGVRAGLVPARDFPAGVIDLAEIDVVAQEGSAADLPGAVGGDRDAGAVFELDGQLGDQARPSDRQGFTEIQIPPHAERQGIVPAVADHDPDPIGALPEQPGHIVRAVKDAFLIIRPTRVEHLVADAAAVERRFIIAQPRDVEPGPLHSRGKDEGSPE